MRAMLKITLFHKTGSLKITQIVFTYNIASGGTWEIRANYYYPGDGVGGAVFINDGSVLTDANRYERNQAVPGIGPSGYADAKVAQLI